MPTVAPRMDPPARGEVDARVGEAAEQATGWRLILSAPAVALVTVIAALIAAAEAGITFRDPDHVAALYIVEVGAGVGALVLLDIYLRARKLAGGSRPSRHQMAEVRRRRWTGKRAGSVALGLVAFYLTYLAYRNLKSAVPLLRPGDLFDTQLADLDRALFFGNDPAALLHSVLGTGGIVAHSLSAFYAAFIVFLPLSLGLALVFSERLQVSLLYATALSINWILGAATYFVLPALGPIYADPQLFSALPHTEVTRLQEMLLDDRVGFLANTAVGTPQAIAAFASLHIAMSFTALLAAYMLGLGRRVKGLLWAWLGLMFVSTVYFGWHYVLDDLAGLLIGAAGLGLACAVTGYTPRPRGTTTAAAASSS